MVSVSLYQAKGPGSSATPVQNVFGITISLLSKFFDLLFCCVVRVNLRDFLFLGASYRGIVGNTVE